MSQQLINRNHDLKRLRDDGYEIDIVAGHLVMRNVPYVNGQKQVMFGTLVSELSMAGDVTITPSTHVINFAGEYPCDLGGNKLAKIVNSESTNNLAEGLTINYSFSSKPTTGYKDYYDKMTTYERILSGPAQAIDPSASAKNFAAISANEQDSPFQYIDTASSRAEIGAVSSKLKIRKVAIIGLGGTGSYVLDLIAKTPIMEIHLFDGDWFQQHNAFRVPGAASLEVLRKRLKKVDYMHGIYSQMHRGIFPHAYKITLENIEELADFDFVFICIDDGPSRKMILAKLEEFGVAFIDVGNRGNTLSVDADPSEKIRGTSPLIAIEILEDYMKHGLYRNADPETRKRQSGKIAWPQVIKKFLPHIREDGIPVYPDLLVRKINYFASNEVTAIHTAVVAILDPLFSWYLDKDTTGIAPELTGAALPYPVVKSIAVLKRELAAVFADREIRLIRNLIMFLENISVSPRDNKIVTGICNFEHVWEDICSVLYKNQAEEISPHIPVPAYIHADGKIERSASNRQRMDIILREGSDIAVLDAKYYDFKTTKPAWSDLVKQFYYATTLATVFAGKKIYNWFVVPAPEHLGRPEKAVIIDKQDKVLPAPFGEIGIIYIDIANAMGDYASGMTADTWRKDVFDLEKKTAA